MAESINRRIARCRKLADLTQTEAAEKMGMKCSTYSQMERKGNISADRLLKLAQIFGVHPDELLYEKKNTSSTPSEAPAAAVTASAPAFPSATIIHQDDYEDGRPVFIISKKEENLLKIIRNLPKSARDEVISFIEQKYRENK